MCDCILPAWLSGHELDPGQGAYSGLPPEFRAALKTQIAMLYRLWGGRHERGFIQPLSSSVRIICERKPLNWALAVFPYDYASPAGIVAALLPAVMAGVEQILICRLDGEEKTVHPSVSAALELLGQEYIYCLGALDCAALMTELASVPSDGCLIQIGVDKNTPILAQCAAAKRIRAFFLPRSATVAVPAGSKADMDLLLWLHPDAVLAESSKLSKTAQPAHLLSAPGYEPFWIWPELEPDNFYHQYYYLSELEARA